MKLHVSSSFFNLLIIRRRFSSYIRKLGTHGSNKCFAVYDN